MGRSYYSTHKEIHGVTVIYIENYKARVATKAVLANRGAWLLLPDGRVGHNDTEFFKWASIGVQKRDVMAAEALWRLGAIKKDVYEKVKKAQEAHEAKRNRGYAIDEFQRSAKTLGIQLTAEQRRLVAAPAARR